MSAARFLHEGVLECLRDNFFPWSSYVLEYSSLVSWSLRAKCKLSVIRFPSFPHNHTTNTQTTMAGLIGWGVNKIEERVDQRREMVRGTLLGEDNAELQSEPRRAPHACARGSGGCGESMAAAGVAGAAF